MTKFRKHRECGNKVKHSDEASAKATIDEMITNGRAVVNEMKVYQCPQCNFYHIAHAGVIRTGCPTHRKMTRSEKDKAKAKRKPKPSKPTWVASQDSSGIGVLQQMFPFDSLDDILKYVYPCDYSSGANHD